MLDQALETMTILELADAFRLGQLSPVEVTTYLLNRIEEEQPRINAFITIAKEEAVIQAQASEARFRTGTPLGLLDGIPYAVKDIIDVKGIPTTMGCKVFEHFVPERSAFAVEKLEKAGAVMLGKTNTSQVALGATGEISAAGPCCNPHDPSRIPGGSSSGSAAAVAAGLVPFALATDTGGSIRNPSGLCGVVGLRPTTGRVSAGGVLQNCLMLDTVGVISRSVVDNALVMDHISGFDPDYPLSLDIPQPHFSNATIKHIQGRRIGFPAEFVRQGTTDYVWEALQRAITRFRSLGMEIVEIEMPDIQSYRPIMGSLLMAEAYSVHKEHLEAHPEWYDPELHERFRSGAQVTTQEYIRMQQSRFYFQKKFSTLFRDVDAVLLPSNAAVAIERNGDPALLLNGAAANFYELSSRYLWFTAFSGTPSLTVPMEFYEGLPLCLQLIAPGCQEHILYELAGQFQKTNTL